MTTTHARPDNLPASDDPQTHGPHGGGYQEHHLETRDYIIVFIVLMVLLVLAIVAGVMIGGTVGTLLGFGIGIAKAILIVLYFMHVRHGTRLTWIFASAAFLWLAILLTFTLADYATRGTTASRADPINEDQVPIVTTDEARGVFVRP